MSDQMKSVMYTLWLVFLGIYFLLVLFGTGADGLLVQFGPFRTGRDLYAFSSLVYLGLPQFLFLFVPFQGESEGLGTN
jgi:hypothetical protein